MWARNRVDETDSKSSTDSTESSNSSVVKEVVTIKNFAPTAGFSTRKTHLFGPSTSSSVDFSKEPEMFVKFEPVVCPIADCNSMLTANSLLGHYIADHLELQFQEAFVNKPITLTFDYNFFKLGENCCLGILGFDDMKAACKPNEEKEAESLRSDSEVKMIAQKESHVPILIMACKCTWGTLSKDPAPFPPNEEVLIMWLCSAHHKEQMYCTLTLYDKLLHRSCSAILPVRNICESQNPSVFVHQSVDFLRVLAGEIRNLSFSGKENIFAEVLINEFND